MSWAEVRLADIASMKTGKVDSNAAVKDGEYPFFTCSQQTFRIDKPAFDTKAVLLGGNNATGVFPLKYYEGQFNAYQRTYVIESLNPDILDIRFLYYTLRPALSYFQSASIGTATQYLTKKILDNFKISLPAIATQQRIASILSAYDDLIENNRRRIELLEQSARLLYKEWFVHLRFPGHEHTTIVDGIPEGWEKGSLSDFFETASGGTPSRKHSSFYEGEINWVKTQELNESFIFDTEEKITEYALAKSSAKLFPENTLLISIYGGTNIGRTGILGSPSASNQACVALFPKHPEANYIFAQQFFQYVRDSLIALAQGSAQTNISQQLLRKFPMVMPTNLAMKPFMEKLVPIYEQVRWLNLSNTKLKIARDLLLPRLMNGDIDLCNIPELH